jgi:multisubunit Na+/H+ antiporter MnhF subunit
MNPPSQIFIYTCMLCLAALFAAGFFCLYRILIGPKAADRAVSLDLLTTIFIGVICVLCIMWGDAWYFDAVWILTLLGFLGSTAIARYMEKGKVF